MTIKADHIERKMMNLVIFDTNTENINASMKYFVLENLILLVLLIIAEL